MYHIWWKQSTTLFILPLAVGQAHEAQPTLTAALADKGTAEIIGEAEGGWFWLPPWS
jgi:hypothetical protein